ncbi:LPXTG-motif cell wall anchor domain protein [Streptococcus mitis]|uniref:LPXTG-motif cell wall anchor domain protein n=1 Tax=Streptococcus mitis TaxID=28037 RepID=A0A081QAZ2_STRMT|nr:YSIRK signal domain/LPXTG anchor domain surface protein [Streptococcus mitis]KEQ40115.1 LPXTG-motif cell wall anchor domain protein [Streptococcus mitis]
MKQAQRKSFDWYKMQQRFSIRKYHFGAASVLLGTALVLGAGANSQTVQADEHYAEVTNSVSVDKIAETTKPAEVSTAKKETTYAAPTVVNPVEVTPAKSEVVKATVEKVEEPKVEKEEVSHQRAVDKSKLLTALSRAKKLESKLYTEASAAKLQASIQAGQGLLGKADASEAEISAAESSIQSAVIGLELRSNSDKGTVSETPVAKKADAAEAKEEAKPAATTTDRSVLDSAVLPTSRAAIVEAFSAPKTTNEILKPGLSLSDAHQNPAIRKEDLDKGQSGFRASSNPANPIVSGSGNTVAFTDISQAGRSYSFRGYGNARGGNSIHYDVTTVRQGNRLNFTIQYSGPGEFVNNNFILDKGDGFGNPSNATITTPRLREQSKPISQGANFVSHSGYTMTSATETSMQQTIRFSLPINNPNGDLSVRLKPVTFNVDQGGGGAATSNDPYSNSNYYYRANPLYLDANPNGGSSNKVVTEDIDFQTVYLPTSKLPEGQTRLVREGEKGQRQITYKVHRFGNETILGLPISNSVTKEAKPRILQIGVAKELIDTVKPRVDQNKVGDTNNLTFYLDNDGNGVYTEGVDELVQKIAIKDGAKGEKGDQGERGLTGAKGEKGDQGERGLTGAKGEKGDQGERGLTGAKGEKGDRGERGLTGAKGEKGDQGERGLTGAKGEKGDQGERGLTGAKGEKGDRGERGLTGAKGEKGDQGQAGRDGVTPTVTVKDNKDDGTHTITINDGRGNVTSTVVRDGFDGASPLVATQRNDADKTTTVIFYYDQNDNNEFDAGDTKLKEVVIADGAKGEKGDKGATPKVTTARGADGHSSDITFTVSGEEPVTVNIKDGKDGRTPTIDLNALVEAVRRGVGSTSNSQPSGTSRSARNRRALPDEDRSATESSETVQPSTTGSTGSQPSTAGSTASQPTSTQPKPSGEYAGTEIKAYYDNNHNGVFDEGDELISSTVIPPAPKGENGNDGKDAIRGAELLSGIIAPRPEDGKDGDTYIDATTGDVYKKRDGAWGKIGNIRGPQGEQGPKGDKGENGRDGFTPEVTVTDNHDGSHTITVTQPEGRPALTTIVKNGVDGQTPKVKAERDEAKKQTTLTFYIDKDGDGNYTEGTDTLVQTSIVKDGQDGAAGQAGRDGKEVLNGKVDPQPRDGKDGDSFVNTATGDVFVKKNNTWEQAGNIKGPKGDKGENGRDGFTPEVTVTDNHDGSHTITVTQPEGRPALTTIVKNGVDGQTPKVKAERDEAKKQTTLTFYIDKDGDGNYTEGTDTLVQTSIVKDGQDGAAGQAGRDGKEVLNGKVDPQPRDGKDGDSFVNTETGDVFVKKNNAWEPAGNIKGPKGDKGENGRDGFTPEVTVTDNHDGSHTITVTQPEGRPALTTIVKNGENGQTPKVKAERDEAKKQTTLTFYIDKDGDGNYTEGTDTLVQTSIVKDGEKGEDGKTPEVTVTPGKDGHSSDITFTVPGKDPVTVNVKNGENGLNGKTPKVDLLRVEGKNGNPSHTIVTFYTDENNDGKYTPGTDELLGSEMIKDGAKGADGRDGKSLLTVKEGKETKVYQEDPANPGQPLTPDRPLAVIRDGVDGKSPTVTAARKEEVDHKGVEITVDNHDGSQPTTVFVHDGAKGETGANGQNGQTPTVTTQRGADGHSTVVTITTPGKEPVTFTVRDGLDGHNGNNGRTPKIDLQPYINGEDSFRRARRSVGNNPDEVSGHPNSRATSSDNADGTHVTVYFDNNGNNHYDPGVDELISERDVLNGVNGENGASGRDGRNGSELLSGNIAPNPKDGKNGDTYIDSSTGDVYKKQNGAWNKTGNIRGPQGAKGDTPEVTAKPGTDGHSTDITITTPGKDPVTVNVKNGKDGKSLIAKKEGNETKIFVEDPERPGQPLDSTKPLATVLDGLKGDKGENGADGKSPVVTVTDNGDGTHSITVRNGDGSESTTKVKDGKDGKTATITTTENPDGSHTITVTNPDGTSKETVVKNGKDGKTPKVEVTDNNDGTHTVKVTDGEGNITNAIIKDGKDGKAASATTRENPDGSHTVTITNPDGTKNEFVVKNGRDGVDGRTPTVSVRDNGDGSHTIVITNPEGVTTETTVRDGKSPKVTITDEQNGTHKISVLNGDGTTTETIIKDGKSPVATVTDNHDGTYTIRVENGNGTVSETTVRDGKSPTAKVVDNGDGTHTITVVNSDGTTTTTTVRDGKEPKLEIIDNNNGSHTIKVTGANGKETTTTIFDGKSPKANIVDNGDGTHTLTIVDSDGREYKSIIKDGKDGKDGVSPTVTVKNNNDGTHVVTIINPDGSKTEMVIKDGKDGKSPKVSVEDNGKGSHTITIINSDGTVTKTVVKDGKDGRDGRDGRDGKDGKDGKCGCQDKPVTPSNDKPVSPTPNVPERPTFAMPEPPVYELPEFNGGVPGMPEVPEVPELDIPTVPAQPTPNVPTPEVPVKPVPAQPTPNVPTPEVPVQPTPVVPTPEVPVKPVPVVPEQPVVPTPAQPATPVNANPVAPTTDKENHGDKLPETGSQSDYISVLLGSGILLSLYVGRRKED